MPKRRTIYSRMATTVQFFIVLISLFKMGVAVDPIIDISEPIVVAGVTDILAEKGSDLEMVCVVENKPKDTKVMWLQMRSNYFKVLSSDTTSHETQKYTVFKPTSVQWRLRIKNMEEGDEGLYRCRVETQPKTYISKSRYVRVVEKPQIDSLQTSSDKIVTEGKPLSLDCYASGRPIPTIIWTRLANADLPSGGKELRNNRLFIASVRPEHRGKYLCRAENVAGDEVRKINVQVRFKPQVTADEKITAQKAGYRKELLCDIKAYPEPKETDVGWTGPLFSENDPNFEITTSKGANNRVTTKLIIKRVRYEDYGDYICSGSNRQGDGQFTIRLDPSDVPVPDKTGNVSGVTSPASFSLLTLLMFVTVFLLHRL